MTDKQIIIDGLSCDNCPESKRCQEQQTKKEYAINQVLQDIPSEYANVIDRLKQIIPSITRCDYVLEKQLKRKEQECEKLKKELFSFMNGDYCANGCEKMNNAFRDAHKCILEENDELKAKIKYMEEYIKTVENARNEFERESKFLKEENKRLKQTLAEIKEIAETISLPMGTGKSCNRVFLAKQILQKISEVEDVNI